MTARILDGKGLALEIQKEIGQEVSQFVEQHSVSPCLAAVLVGEDPASQVYVRNKQRACERVGIDSQLHRLAQDAPQQELLDLLDQLNSDPAVHGILVQLPLPDHIDATLVLDRVTALKDVDAFHPENVGLLSQGRPRYLPCTPHGVQQILHRCNIEVQGKHVVILGRSEIVGKPLALMLAQKDSTCGPNAANATVTVCHSRTQNLADITRQADILIAAIGKPKFVTEEMVTEGTTIIDVGVNRTEEGLCGDVDFESISKIASAITPVPGGVGPMTITMLLYNTLAAAKRLT